MSAQKIREAASDFLKCPTPEVMSLKGGWGVGKTYFWNTFIRDAAQNRDYRFERYAYVSLFGLASLAELKLTIFEQVVGRSQIGQRISVENLRRNADDLAKKLGRKALHLLEGLPWLSNYGSAINSAAFLSVKDTLICLDDFERKADTLPAKDILGLVSILKEQRNCQVLLIFNDGNMADDAQREYEQFREKVIDIEVTYSPTAQEQCALVFCGQSETDRKLTELAIELNITNVRILRKIQKAVEGVARPLAGMEPEVLHQAMHTLTLFGWCYYSRCSEVPTIEHLKHYPRGLYGDDTESEPEQIQTWNALLRRYGYLATSEFDLALATVIETGVVDNDFIRAEADKINIETIANKRQTTFRTGWDLFNNSFALNQSEVVKKLDEGLRLNSRNISPLQLDATVCLLRDLGESGRASDLIAFYLTSNADRPTLFDLDTYPFSSDIRDVELIKKFSEVFNKSRQVTSVAEVLSKIAGKNGWGRSDEEVLATATAEDFYKIFKNTTGRDLGLYVDVCLRFGRFQNATEQQNSIATNAKNALIRIGAEGKINELRVKKLGISVQRK